VTPISDNQAESPGPIVASWLAKLVLFLMKIPAESQPIHNPR
jgi:hypothetical protein